MKCQIRKILLSLLAVSAVLAVSAQGGLTLNPVDFGADNTGVKDCTAALDKMLATIGGKRQICVHIPAGRYRVTKPVVFNQKAFEGYAVNCGLNFCGEGEDVTEIVCDNNEGAFLFDANTNLVTVTVENMSFVAPHDGCGTAISFNTAGRNAGDHHSRMFQVRNVLIRGERYDKGFFNCGVRCQNAWYPSLENVKVTARYGSGSERYKMDCGFLFEDCYSPLVARCYFWGAAAKGLYYKAVKIQPEDGIVRDTYFVGQDYGVYVDIVRKPDWPEPAFHLTGCHINYSVNGLFLNGMRQVFITGNLFYCHNEQGSRWKKDVAEARPFESVDINLEYASDVIISDNQFTEPATPKRIGINISEHSAAVVIKGNIFNFDGTGVRNRSRHPSYLFDNVWQGEPDFGAGFVRVNDETGTLEEK